MPPLGIQQAGLLTLAGWRRGGGHPAIGYGVTLDTDDLDLARVEHLAQDLQRGGKVGIKVRTAGAHEARPRVG